VDVDAVRLGGGLELDEVLIKVCKRVLFNL
jgi:hypothetical protein